MVVHELASGSLLIDDCYNANPTSVVAALRTLADLDVSRRIAVLGEMAEVDDPVAAHRSVAETASHLGIGVIPIMTDLYGEEDQMCCPLPSWRCSHRRHRGVSEGKSGCWS